MELRLPNLAAGMEFGTVLSWLKQPGEAVVESGVSTPPTRLGWPDRAEAELLTERAVELGRRRALLVR